jgi:hypothetical protein
VLAVVGTASAQAPGQIPIPQQLPGGSSHGQVIVSPAQVAGTPIAPVGGQVFVRGSGGCNGCGSAAAAAPCTTSNGCNNGCGSLKGDCGFIFGSCKSFFNPCGPQPLGGGWGGAHGHLLGGKHGGNGGCGGGCGGGLFGHGRCGSLPYGTPYGHPCNPCVYDTYLNH